MTIRAEPSLPRVSVLIAARNRRDMLPACLASVRSQTYRDHEIVLIDDGSTDGTDGLAGLADVYRWTPPRGCSHARNLAMSLARGEYLYVLDSDDYLAPRALELSVAAIEQTGGDMVFSDLFVVAGEGRIAGIYQAREQSALEVVEEKWIPHPSTMMRRRTLTIEYDETLPSAEDLDFLLRYMPGKVINRIPTPLYYYRFHSGQAGANPLQSNVARGIRERWRAAQATR